MAISAEIYITLQKIIMFAQEKKLELLRGGRGIEEPIQREEPHIEDMQPKKADPAPIGTQPKLVHTDEGLPAPSARQLSPPKTSVKDLIEADDTDAQQLSLEEVMSAIGDTEDTAKDAPSATPEPSPTQEDAQLKNEDPAPEEDETQDPLRYSMWDKIKDWREAWRNWKVEKWRKDYEYACKKQAIKDMCIGYDEIIAYVKQLMSDWDGIAADDNIADVANVTISGVHDGLGV